MLQGESFQPDGCSPIPEAAWASLLAACSEEQQAVLASGYVLADQEYRLAEGLSSETLAQVLRILDQASGLPGSIFAVLPGDSASARRLILLTEEELARFVAGSEAEIGQSQWKTAPSSTTREASMSRNLHWKRRFFGEAI